MKKYSSIQTIVTLLIVLNFLSGETAPYSSSMIMKWSFDQDTKVEEVKRTTTTISGTFSTALISASGKGRSFYLDGANRLNVPISFPLPGGTICFWAVCTNNLRTTGQNNMYLLDTWGGARFSLWQDNLNYSFELRNTTNALFAAKTSDASLQLNIWQFWTATWTNGEMKIYIDGVQRGSANYVGTLTTGTSFVIGDKWRGYIDEIYIYKRVLSSNEINILKTNSIGRSTPLPYTPPTQPESAPYSDSELMRWTFDNGTSSEEKKGIGTAEIGTFSAVSTSASGAGKSYYLDGVSKLTVSTNLSTIAGTVSVWAACTNNLRTTGQNSMYLFDTYVGNNKFSLWQLSSDYNATLRNAANATVEAKTTDDSFLLNAWQFWTVTWSDGALRLYVDGVLKDTTNYSGAWTNGASLDMGVFWRGFIDDFRVYSRALSSNEIYILRTNTIQRANPIAFVPPPPPSPTVFTNEPFLHWTFDDGTSKESIQQIEVSSSGIFDTAACSPSGKGLSYALDGSSYLSVPTNLSTSGGSICIWALATNRYRLTDGKANMYLLDSYLGNNKISLWQMASNYNFTIRNGANVTYDAATANRSFQLNNWHFWTATWAAGSMQLYLDGALIESTTYSGAWTNANFFTIGNSWRGFIDDIIIYNYPLTASQVAIVKTNSIQRATPTSYYRFLKATAIPASNSIYISRSSQFRFVFDAAPYLAGYVAITDGESLSSQVVLKALDNPSSNVSISAIYSSSDKTITITPAISLINSKKYSVSISGIYDINGADCAGTTATIFTIEPEMSYTIPIAHWPLDNPQETTTIADTSGNGYHGIGVGTTYTPEERFDGAQFFHGGADKITFPNPFKGVGTIMFWVYPSDLSQVDSDHPQYLMGNSPLTPYPKDKIEIYLESSLGDLSIGLGPKNYTVSHLGKATPGKWTHVALSLDSEKYYVYLDGALLREGSRPVSASMQTPLPNSIVAGNSGATNMLGSGFYGMLRDFKIFDAPLQSDEINFILTDSFKSDSKTDVEEYFEMKTSILYKDNQYLLLPPAGLKGNWSYAICTVEGTLIDKGQLSSTSLKWIPIYPDGTPISTGLYFITVINDTKIVSSVPILIIR